MAFTHAFRRFVAKHKPPPADLRHPHAAAMLKGKVPPEVAQERLGHSTIAITLDIYRMPEGYAGGCR